MAKLSTEICRELFLYGPVGGKRITSVKDLVRLSGASERAIRANLPAWKNQSEELAANSMETGLAFCLSSSALACHQSDVAAMRSEVDRLTVHLRSLAPSDESYPAVSRSFLTVQKQWSQMAGILALIDAAACRIKETEKLKARAEAANLLNDPPADEPEASVDVVFKRRG